MSSQAMLAYSPGNFKCVALTMATSIRIKIITKRDGIFTSEINSPAIVDDICYRMKVWKLDQTAIEVLNESSTGWGVARHKASKSRPPKDECYAGSHKNHKTYRPHWTFRRKIP